MGNAPSRSCRGQPRSAGRVVCGRMNSLGKAPNRTAAGPAARTDIIRSRTCRSRVRATGFVASPARGSGFPLNSNAADTQSRSGHVPFPCRGFPDRPPGRRVPWTRHAGWAPRSGAQAGGQASRPLSRSSLRPGAAGLPWSATVPSAHAVPIHWNSRCSGHVGLTPRRSPKIRRNTRQKIRLSDVSTVAKSRLSHTWRDGGARTVCRPRATRSALQNKGRPGSEL